MAHDRPHILLITTDQQRGDCLGLAGHPVLQTANLDDLGGAGAMFTRAYAECPACVPARRTLMTGMAPAAQGMVGMTERVDFDPPHTLAGELARAGYQTRLVGKLHLHPQRKRFGFEHQHLADSIKPVEQQSDYVDWLIARGESDVLARADIGKSHGVGNNSWVARPHVLAEDKLHAYWCVSRCIDFLSQRDPTAPFFLNLSFVDPHPPLTPPAWHYGLYHGMDLPGPVIGDWADPADPRRGRKVDAAHLTLDPATMHRTRAGYYGLIHFVDDQVGRLLNFMQRAGVLGNTLVLFTSDHGEMLGDHHLFRKSLPYEASARVPMLLKAPPHMGCAAAATIDAPVGLQDVMPTLLDAAGLDVPATCTGRSMLPLVRGAGASSARAWLHGESAGGGHGGVHWLVDRTHKYIWWTRTGREQLFDLARTPNEERDLALAPDAGPMLAPWRARLADVLKDRPEGFVRAGRLVPGQRHEHLVPEHPANHYRPRTD